VWRPTNTRSDAWAMAASNTPTNKPRPGSKAHLRDVVAPVALRLFWAVAPAPPRASPPD
jgi:hypothetical protein